MKGFSAMDLALGLGFARHAHCFLTTNANCVEIPHFTNSGRTNGHSYNKESHNNRCIPHEGGVFEWGMLTPSVLHPHKLSDYQ